MGKGKWDPWRGMDEFREQVERYLDESCGGVRNVSAAGYVWSPLADLVETPQAITAQVELPGVRLEHVLVEIIDGDLVVRGERPCERFLERSGERPAEKHGERPGENECQGLDQGDCIYHIMERAHGTFARRFPLPPGIDGAAVSARLEGGLLTVTIPKRQERRPGSFSLTID